MTVPVRQAGICQERRAAAAGRRAPGVRLARAAFAALPHAGVFASRWPYQDAGAGQRRTSRWKISRLSFLVCMKSGALSVSSVRGRGAA